MTNAKNGALLPFASQKMPEFYADVAEKEGSGRDNRAENRVVGRREKLQGSRDTFYIDVGRHFHGVSVDMRHTGFFAADAYFPRTDYIDKAFLRTSPVRMSTPAMA